MAGLTVVGRLYSVWLGRRMLLTPVPHWCVYKPSCHDPAGDLFHDRLLKSAARRSVHYGGVCDIQMATRSMSRMETTTTWSDRRPIAQFGTDWTGDHLKTVGGIPLNAEERQECRSGTVQKHSARRNTAYRCMTIASAISVDRRFRPFPAVSRNEWRIIDGGDLATIVGAGGDVVGNSEKVRTTSLMSAVGPMVGADRWSLTGLVRGQVAEC